MIKFKLATGYDERVEMIPSHNGDYVLLSDALKMEKLLRTIQVEHCDTAGLYNMIDDLLDEINAGE